jgi:outer membrane receptor protein involved in Fe transport
MPADYAFGAVDVSAIPLSAVQRVEVVPDGASAIYGSDAVAGVVNFILRRDFTGTEISARAGGATQGGADESTFSVLSGWAGKSSHVLADLEYSNSTAVSASQRTFAAGAPPAEYLLQPQKRKSLFLSGGHDITDSLSLSFDGLISDRESPTLTQRTATSAIAVGNVYTPAYSADVGLEAGLWSNWKLHATVNASGSRNATWYGASKSAGRYSFMENGVRYGEVTADGTLLQLPSGDVKAAVGGGYRDESFHNGHPGSSSYFGGTRQVSYAYAEAYVPLVQTSEDRVGLNSLDLNLSARTEHYSDFGSTTNPKVGLRYVPFNDLTVRASWGTSFKAPTFLQMYQARYFEIWNASGLGYSGAGSAVLLQGGNPDLKPEKSRSWTFGADYKPSFAPSLVLSATYFNIDYRDRVVQPVANIGIGLSSPLYTSFVEAPTASRLSSLYSNANLVYNFSSGAYDPTTVVGIVNDNYTNATSQRVHGIDTSYRQNFAIGDLALNAFANATWLHLDQQTIPTLPAQTLSGTLYAAPDFKARGGLTLTAGQWTLTGDGNFIDSEIDTEAATPSRIASWTTVDATVVYRFAGAGFGRGLKLIGAASNLFDKGPPHAIGPTVSYPGLDFDSTNASLLGRYLSLTIVKAW